MNEWKIYFVGLASAFCDVATTWVGLQFPELQERNPLANPFLEAATVLGGQWLVLKLGEKLNVPSNVRFGVALMPCALPFYAALNNSLLIAEAYGKRHPEKAGLILALAPLAVGSVLLVGGAKS